MRRLTTAMVLILGQLFAIQIAFSRGSQMNGEQKSMEKTTSQREIATLGGGCFWCLEAVFEELDGVERVVSGYAGGVTKNPSYEDVCAGTTGHAEVVQIEFDPAVIGYEKLLDVFFAIHDPTTLNRQGADVGSQYRSVIFYHDDGQKQLAEKKIEEIESSGKMNRPVVTELAALEKFYEAEAYHQDYFKRNPEAAYCGAVITPKLIKFRDIFEDELK